MNSFVPTSYVYLPSYYEEGKFRNHTNIGHQQSPTVIHSGQYIPSATTTTTATTSSHQTPELALALALSLGGTVVMTIVVALCLRLRSTLAFRYYRSMNPLAKGSQPSVSGSAQFSLTLSSDASAVTTTPGLIDTGVLRHCRGIVEWWTPPVRKRADVDLEWGGIGRVPVGAAMKNLRKSKEKKRSGAPKKRRGSTGVATEVRMGDRRVGARWGIVFFEDEEDEVVDTEKVPLQDGSSVDSSDNRRSVATESSEIATE